MTTNLPIGGLILAAGKGTRMKGSLPKCLHRVCGEPMVSLVIDGLTSVGVDRPVVVVGHGGDEMIAELGDSCDYAWQHEQKGTGHAVLMAKEAFAGFQGSIIVACGDTPLLRPETFQRLAQSRAESGAQCVMAVVEVADPKGYGRILRDDKGQVRGIIEEKDIQPNERDLLKIREINPALYCFDAETLFSLLPDKPSEATGEYYLTDIIAAIREHGGVVEGINFTDEEEFMGVNDRWQLAKAAKALRMRILERHARNGVTIVDPDSTFIANDVEIGPDTEIQPMTVIEGRTVIGEGCRIGPNTWIKDARIANRVRVFMSHIDQAEMGEGSRCGPFANLRPDTVMKERVKVGNFVELKNAVIGNDTSISHLTYVGDASVGERSNIGAGTITCNYDGYLKHRTEIGNDVFIGSNSTLVAPLKVGDGAMTAAGSVVTKEVPSDSLAIGRGRQENKDGWVMQWRELKKAEKEAKA